MAHGRSGDAVADHDVIDGRERDERPFYREILAGLGIGAVATVILRARGEAVGCLYLGRTGPSSRFRPGDVDLLRAAAPILGLGVALHGADAPKHPRPIPALASNRAELAGIAARLSCSESADG